MTMRYEARQRAYDAIRTKIALLQPGIQVLVEVTIGKEIVWLPGQVKRHGGNGQLVVEVEYKDMAGERRWQTVTVGPEKLRLAKEGTEE